MNASVWAKICGVRDAEEAVSIAKLGAHALGLNLWPGSPRYVTVAQARCITQALDSAVPGVERVGVTVNMASSVEAYVALVEEAGLTCVQLHGDEPEALMHELSQTGVPVIRALRLDASADRNKACKAIEAALDAGARVLLDARVAGTYGGTGKALDRALLTWLLVRYPLIVAGGLGPDNVAEVAGLAARADGVGGPGVVGVDVASGVENAEGRKDLDAVGRFLNALGAKRGV